MFNVEIVANELVEWIKERVKEAGADGIVLGLSGGVDSAVVAAAAKKAFPENTLGIIMPCHSNPQDEKDAVLLAERLNIKYKKVVLDDVYDTFLKEVGATGNENKLALANIKPRLRMTTLYYHAALFNYLVAGTGNKSELTVGYFTKYGDSGVDILPLASFVKHQVWELARYFNVPDEIVNKAPSAGLWENQTDENEMGITYKELDDYILTGEATNRVKNIVDELNRKSQHKREMPKMFVPKNM
ncbi:NH(3)-dependent NAD(+) synthetase [Caloramator mitchellensis]|uniref:NH(3)-dependent NAD(+) synthetase n=1 Tax=Caloramator mitchellensis TaxID=908809 RepID=A0A0R3K562_CALMK|nr:NAD(+) synthase [Caloramator mitchellensis]KRQ87503.1 NH(3)-dependent NAD(+) synthetase [Caloramator mitchellensis]